MTASEGMRILHVITRYLGGGSERSLLAQMQFERSQGDEVHLVVGRDSEVTGDAREFLVETVPTLIRGVDPIADVRAYRALRGLIARNGYDVVFTHQSKAGVLGRLAARDRARGVAHIVAMSAFGPGYPRPASMVFEQAERLCARFTDFIVPVGQELRRDYLAAGVGSDTQYRVVRSPIKVDAFLATRMLDAAQRGALRTQFAVPNGARVLVSVGALERRKRHALLIRSLTPLLASGAAVLLLAGDGPERDRLERLVAELGIARRVRFLGHIPNVDELLAVADLLVHASTAEGVPQVVVQALAAAVPVVATEVTGLREVDGAPVTVVPVNGGGLLEAAQRALEVRHVPLPVESFDQWTPASVLRQHEALREELRARVRERAGRVPVGSGSVSR